MSLPVYVTNFDELMLAFGDALNVQIDMSSVEDILNQHFPEIIDLLKRLQDQSRPTTGIQKIKGFAIIEDSAIYKPDKDILITGLTFSQDIFDRGGFDKWQVMVTNGEESIILLEDVYAKDSLQHKHFEAFYLVPKGYEIIATITKSNTTDKVYWLDIEYLELNIIPSESQ